MTFACDTISKSFIDMRKGIREGYSGGLKGPEPVPKPKAIFVLSIVNRLSAINSGISNSVIVCSKIKRQLSSKLLHV